MRYSRRPDELSSRNLQNIPREEAGGRYAADLFLQLPARGSGSAAIPALSARAKRATAHLTGQHRLKRYHIGTADPIVRRYGANVRREVRIPNPDTASHTPIY